MDWNIGGDQAIDLLTNMLKFNGKKRLNTKRILDHGYFKRVRDVKNEFVINKKPKDEFECLNDKNNIDIDNIRELICKEICVYNKDLKKLIKLKNGIDTDRLNKYYSVQYGWSIERLLWIAFKKNDEQNDYNCFLPSLPKEVIQHIVNFLFVK